MAWIFEPQKLWKVKEPDPPPLPEPELASASSIVEKEQGDEPTKDIVKTDSKGSVDDPQSAGSDFQVPSEEPKKVVEEEDDFEVRESWGSKFSYVLTLVGYAVGFGNIWRFPFLLHSNGGVAFLIPYVIMLIFAGIPIFFLELAIGQRMKKGALGTWNEIAPFMGGLGLTCGLTCFFVELYYNTLVSWVLLYIFDSFRTSLQWESCSTAFDINLGKDNITNIGNDGKTYSSNECLIQNQATSYYFYRRMMDVSEGMTHPGNFNPWMLLSLGISWLLVWAILVKGIKSSEKVVYFTALFPYVVLLIFFIGNFFVPGWENGYNILFKPDWSVLIKPITWLRAGSQIFFSLGVAFGCLIVFASYLPSDNDCYRDAISVSIINCATSLFAAVVIFPIFGSLGTKKYHECINDRKLMALHYLITESKELQPTPEIPIGIKSIYSIVLATRDSLADMYTIPSGMGGEKGPVEQIIQIDVGSIYNAIKDSPAYKWTRDELISCDLETIVRDSGSGTSLVFVGFAEAVLNLPFPPFWSLLFFVMLLTLGIDSSFGTLEGAIAVFVDMRLVDWPRWAITSLTVLVLFGLSTVFCFGWGMYVQNYLDQFLANWSLLIIGFFECIAIAWVYGLAKFTYEIKLMTGRRPSLFMMTCWRFLTPGLIIFILVADIVYQGINGYTTSEYRREKGKMVEKEMDGYVIAIGYLMFLGIIIWVPLQAVLKHYGKSLFKDEVPIYFPEEELRIERKMSGDDEEEFDKFDKLVMGKSIEDFKELQIAKSRGSVEDIARTGSKSSVVDVVNETKA